MRIHFRRTNRDSRTPAASLIEGHVRFSFEKSDSTHLSKPHEIDDIERTVVARRLA